MKKPKPLVYSCSGCSSAGQMANYMALELDKKNVAKMSCIAGVGGNVPTLLNVAENADEIIAIDGCSLHCVENCLKRHDISIKKHVKLYQHGVKKLKNTDFDKEQADSLIDKIFKKF